MAGPLTHEQALAQIARAMIQTLDLREIAAVVIEQCVLSLGADAAVLWLADCAHRELRLLANRGISAETATRIRVVPFDAPLLAASVARSGRIQTVECAGIGGAEPTSSDVYMYMHQGMHAVLVVPLTVRGQLVGVLSHGFCKPRRFSEADHEFNMTAAGMFAVTVRNARLYEEVRQTLQLHEEFMAAAAHELRTPLTVIKGKSQRVLRTDAQDREVRMTFETILREADRMDDLVDDLLTIQRVAQGHSTMRCARLDLGARVRTVVDEIARTTTERRFQLQVQAGLVVKADRALIDTAIRHLLEHAVRYTPVGGLIEVGARADDGDGIVTVIRHGPSIPQERQPHIFEPFYEPIPPGGLGYAGTVSLGMYLSKRIVDAQGGRIGLIAGSGDTETVWLRLPLARPQK